MGNQTHTQNQAAPAPAPTVTGGVLQRACDCGQHTNGEEKCSTCAAQGGLVQRAAVNNPAGTNTGVPPIVGEVLSSPGAPLDSGARSFMETRFGHDFSGVRVHTSSQAAASARAVNALAYTVGQQVVFGTGQYAPGTSGGQALLAHELAHVVQQRYAPASALQPLRLGTPGDASEVAADTAAHAVLNDQPVPDLGYSAALIRRAPADYQVLPGRTPDERKVPLGDDARIYVKRVIEIVPRSRFEQLPPKFSVGADKTNVYIRLDWCRNAVKGQVDLGANVPEKGLDFLKQVGQIILKNGSAQDVYEALKNETITPYLSTKITSSGSFDLSANVRVTVGKAGVTAGGGGLQLDMGKYGKLEGKIEGGTVDGRPDVRGGITYTIPLGSKPKQVTCPNKEVVELVQNVRYTCYYEFDTSDPTTEKRDVPVTDERNHYIYFRYAKPIIDGSNPRNATEATAMAADLRDGFQVRQIVAYASPEGPIGPGPNFEGNQDLSQERADRAVQEVETIGKRAGVKDVFVGQDAKQSAIGLGEKYTLVRPVNGEMKPVEGDDQANYAAERFQDTENDEETDQRTPDVTKALEKQKTAKGRAAIVYPLLRRATIRLVRTRTEQRDVEVPGPVRQVGGEVECSPDVIEAVKPSFEK